jgi:chitodextrinase
MTHAMRSRLILAMVRRDLRQIHRQGLASILLAAVLLFLFGVFLFSAARSTLLPCGTPEWTGDPLRKCAESAASLRVSIIATPPQGEAPLAVTFAAAVTGGRAPYTYAWTFGDGADSTEASPAHTYANPGVPVVRVRVTDATRAELWSGFLSVVVRSPGSSDLQAGLATNVSEAGAPMAVGFSSVVSGGTPPYAYTWAFGEGANGTGPATTHTYAQGGEYAAHLVVRDTGGNETRTGAVTLTAYDPGGEGGLPFSVLDAVYGFHVLVTMLIPTMVFSGAYGAEARKGTVRTLVCYPIGVAEVTLAKLLDALIAGLLIATPIALIPSAILGMPGGAVLGIYATAFVLSYLTLATAVFTAHAFRLHARVRFLPPTLLPYVFVLYAFFFTRIAVFLFTYLGMGGRSIATNAGTLAPLILFSPYHHGGVLLSAALGGGGFPLLPMFAIPAVLLLVGYRAARRLYPDIYEKE